jgi:hypothetical protein
METDTKALTDKVELGEVTDNGPNSELDEFKQYIMQAIGQAIDDKLSPVWQRLQKVEAKAEINSDTNAETRGIVKNHVHVNQ